MDRGPLTMVPHTPLPGGLGWRGWGPSVYRLSSMVRGGWGGERIYALTHSPIYAFTHRSQRGRPRSPQTKEPAHVPLPGPIRSDVLAQSFRAGYGAPPIPPGYFCPNEYVALNGKEKKSGQTTYSLRSACFFLFSLPLTPSGGGRTDKQPVCFEAGRISPSTCAGTNL